MKNKKILYISQEITPYLPESEISKIGRYLPQGVQEKGREIRTFMPRFGNINERRNQLHEVIRLSGMNLIINDTDHPLIIKVASIQAARMQVYFIDNEDYFHRKFTLKDENGKFFEDNDERIIFFARGVIETVRKLRWSPDIIHCHGWFSSLVPLYIKKSFQDDPLFMDSKIVFSIYNNEFPAPLNNKFVDKVVYDGIKKDDLKIVKNPTYENLIKLTVDHSDALIMGSEEINKEAENYIKKSKKPFLTYQDEENYIDAYTEFYEQL